MNQVYNVKWRKLILFKKRFHFLFVICMSVWLLPAKIAAQPGAIDLTFNPTDQGFGNPIGTNEYVYTSSLQPDGKIIIGGNFTFYNGTFRRFIARMNADGSLDTTFNPGIGANGVISIIKLQTDGKILIGGSFTTFNYITRNGIARLNADGSLDSSFNPGSGGNNYNTIYSINIQPDGKSIVAGAFTTFNSISKNRIVRLNSDGSVDGSFNIGSGADNFIYTSNLLPDGKIIIGGGFFSYNGTSRNGIARLNADGSLDASFNPGTGANNAIFKSEIQTDNKIIITGSFTAFNGTSRIQIARLNADGSLDAGFNPGTGTNNYVYEISIQPDNKIIISGWFTSYNGTIRNGVARLNANGSLDGSFNPGTGANASIRTHISLPNGKIFIGGEYIYYGTIVYRIARLNTNGSIDPEFNTATGSDNYINAICIQPDGKIIIGGGFTFYNHITRNRIARLNPDGSLDASFNPGTGADAPIYSINLQSDGKIIIGGMFSNYNGTSINRLARLNTDGSLDVSFNTGSGANGGSIYTSIIQPDGKIIIGGWFTHYNGVSRNRIARVNANGSLDASFNPGSGTDNINSSSYIWAISLQSDDKIIIGGTFSVYNGTSINGIARLNTNGSIDGTFNPGMGANNPVFSTAIQSDGKIIIGGIFTSYNGLIRYRIARLNADGSLDPSFYPNTGPNDAINCINIQPNGKIIIGGSFTSINGIIRNRIARLNADGTLDVTFNPGTGANNTVYTNSIQSDGKIIIGGSFTSYNGTGRNRVARVLGDPCTEPVITLNGPSPVCQNSTGNVYTTEAGMTGYLWSVTGGTITASGTSASNTATVTWTGSGTQSISVNYTNANGCRAAASNVLNVIVNPLLAVTCPANLSVCSNAVPFALSDLGGMPTGGAYNGNGVSAGMFDPSSAGVGIHTISYSYTDSTGCSNSCTFNITVNPIVSAGTISGTSPLCVGNTALYTSSGTPGGEWFSINPSVASVNATTGLVTALSPGQTDIAYFVSSGCGSPTTMWKTLIVSQTTAGTVSGASSLCIGTTANYFSSGTGGGTWSSTNPSVAIVDMFSGLVTALSGGTSNITYTIGTGCSTPLSTFKTLTVNPNVNAGTVSGASSLCVGATTTYTSNGTPGGTWISIDPSVATVNATTGLVTAISAGTTNISYLVNTGCGSPAGTFKTITVNPKPTAGFIVNNSSQCVSSNSFVFVNTSFISGGTLTYTWNFGDGSSATTTNATHSYALAGVYMVKLDVTSSNGCMESVIQVVMVNPLPTVTCPADLIVYNSTPSFVLTGGSPTGGVYSGTGVSGGIFIPAVAGIGIMTITYSYTDPLTGCSNFCTFTITVNETQPFIHGTVRKNVDPTKIDIVFQPTFTSTTGEYIFYMQFSLAIPVGLSGGVTATALGVNTFSNMGTLVQSPPYTEGSEQIFTWIFADPTPATQSWTNGVAFIGIEVTFSNAAAAAIGKMVDFTNIGGGGNANTYFAINSTRSDLTDYPALFHAIPGRSMLGNYPNNNQYVITTETNCSTANGGTATVSTSFCVSGTPTITASGYSTGLGSTYQWISSSSAIDYPASGTLVAGQTNPATLTTGVVTATTYYWLQVLPGRRNRQCRRPVLRR